MRRAGRAVDAGAGLPETGYPSDVEVRVPRELLWDYREPPKDALWRLQRIAEWFPAYGRDRETVRQLFERRAELRIPEETRALIELYEEAWRERRP